MNHFFLFWYTLFFMALSPIYSSAFANNQTRHIEGQAIVAKPEKGFYLEPFTEFGQSSPTDGDSPRPSYGFGLNLGWMQASNLWTRLEPSFEIFSKSLNSTRRNIIIPIGASVKVAYAYRVGPNMYAGPAIGLGMGLASYQETRSEIKYESSSQVPVQTISGQFLVDFIAGTGLSFRTGIKASHYLMSVDELEFESNTIKLDKSTHFNSVEIIIALRLKFPS